MSSNEQRRTVVEEDDDFDDLLDGLIFYLFTLPCLGLIIWTYPLYTITDILDDFTQEPPAQSEGGHASSSKDDTQRSPTEEDLEREVEELFNDQAFEDTFHAFLKAFDDANINDSVTTAANASTAKEPSQSGETGGTKGGSFQDHINQTMNMLKNSSDQLDVR